MNLIKKQIELVAWIEKQIENFEGSPFEMKDYKNYLNIQNRILYRLGYRKPRIKADNTPPKINPYKRPAEIVPELKEVTQEKKQGPKENKYLNKDIQAQVLALYYEGLTTEQISNKLWINESRIKKAIEKPNKNLIADNSKTQLQQLKEEIQ